MVECKPLIKLTILELCLFAAFCRALSGHAQEAPSLQPANHLATPSARNLLTHGRRNPAGVLRRPPILSANRAGIGGFAKALQLHGVERIACERAELLAMISKLREENTELAVDAYAYFGSKTTLSRYVVEATRKWPLMHSPSAGSLNFGDPLAGAMSASISSRKSGWPSGGADSREGLTAARRPAP